jgi:hypothetical protein
MYQEIISQTGLNEHVKISMLYLRSDLRHADGQVSGLGAEEGVQPLSLAARRQRRLRTLALRDEPGKEICHAQVSVGGAAQGHMLIHAVVIVPAPAFDIDVAPPAQVRDDGGNRALAQAQDRRDFDDGVVGVLRNMEQDGTVIGQ